MLLVVKESRMMYLQGDNVFKDLREKHGNEYDAPKLRLWARMISSGIHDDYDSPPDVPMFLTPSTKKTRKEPLSEVLSAAAVAIVKSLDKSTPSNSTVGLNPQGVSPGKSVDLRMKNYEQLRYLKQLYEDGIFDEKEYNEQKKSIVLSLRKLN